jgi:hypothetical protein
MEGTENQSHGSGWGGILGEIVVESNGGGRYLARVPDNETHEGVCLLHD